jgi:DNA repair exonuclease SbcCD nuclease subunit
MSKICVLGDAHLLAQAEWIEDERILSEEVAETLQNFLRAIDKVSKESPDAVVFVGDIFDQRTFSRQRVAHREAEPQRNVEGLSRMLSYSSS